MPKIFKYELNDYDNIVSISIHSGAKILCVQPQRFLDRDIVKLWAEIDESNPIEIRKFKIYGTGYEITEDPSFREYVGTVQQNGMVWHVFEIYQEQSTNNISLELGGICQNCGGLGDHHGHTCPYAEEINGDHTYCNCCPTCTSRCMAESFMGV